MLYEISLESASRGVNVAANAGETAHTEPLAKPSLQKISNPVIDISAVMLFTIHMLK